MKEITYEQAKRLVTDSNPALYYCSCNTCDVDEFVELNDIDKDVEIRHYESNDSDNGCSEFLTIDSVAIRDDNGEMCLVID